MKKINSYGFALAETLIVTVFLLAIFTLIFTSFLPLVGEYEKREAYDTVDGKYKTYLIKKMIEDPSYQISEAEKTSFRNNKYARFKCSDMVGDEEKKSTCIKLVKSLEVTNCNDDGDNCEIFITTYRLDGNEMTKSFKKTVKAASRSVFRTGWKDYIRALPDYSSGSLNDARFRVLVSYHHKKGNNNYYSYATMEVIH